LLTQEDAQTLSNLGLTLSQATVYLAMFKLKNPTAPASSKATNVARQDAYRIISELEDLGLVERVIATPTEFRPISIKYAIQILGQRRYDKEAELRKKASKLIVDSKKWMVDTETRIDKPIFAVYNVTPKDPRLKAEIKSSETVLRFLANNIGYPFIFSIHADLKQALKRGVKIKMLTGLNHEREVLPKFMDTLRQDPLFQIRYAPILCSANILIRDTKDVRIRDAADFRTKRGRDYKMLWTNQSALIELAIDYFEKTWNIAKDDQADAKLSPHQLTPEFAVAELAVNDGAYQSIKDSLKVSFPSQDCSTNASSRFHSRKQSSSRRNLGLLTVS
jgi:sugar-specific transcriptional regulator TrmB